ncbi:SHOCT domain-containing protein [Arthrobacter castelli]|uniref:SHOCT domain-containing protein n=1 Tax=Arthrobacter castelli TaxID=271431 RepID=UPI00041F09EE|nr:SHOCT domain-containing protein [Arthrobacter castelli]
MFNLTTTVAAAPMEVLGPFAWGAPPFPFFLIPLFWLLIFGSIVTALFLTRRRRRRLCATQSGERALAERFAAGDIDEDEFRQRRDVLHERR